MLGGASSGSLLIGSGAFSSAQADRSVNVSVVDDETAFVGYHASDRTVPADKNDDGTVDLVTVENRFGENVKLTIVDVDIEVSSQNSSEVDIDDIEGEGETFDDSAVIRGAVSCSGNGEASRVAVTVTVEASNISAQLFGDTREFEISCIEPVSGVTFRGAGNADADAGGRTLDAEAWFVKPGDDVDGLDLSDARVEGEFAWDTSNNLQNSFSGDPSGKLVAVRFTETNQVFINPSYDISIDDLPARWRTDEVEK